MNSYSQFGVLLVVDHLQHLSMHRHLVGHGYRLVKRTGVNNWYVPQGQPFHITRCVERLALFGKMFLSLSFRKLKRVLLTWSPRHPKK